MIHFPVLENVQISEDELNTLRAKVNKLELETKKNSDSINSLKNGFLILNKMSKEHGNAIVEITECNKNHFELITAHQGLIDKLSKQIPARRQQVRKEEAEESKPEIKINSMNEDTYMELKTLFNGVFDEFKNLEVKINERFEKFDKRIRKIDERFEKLEREHALLTGNIF